jgi:hypothetical protein
VWYENPLLKSYQADLNGPLCVLRELCAFVFVVVRRPFSLNETKRYPPQRHKEHKERTKTIFIIVGDLRVMGVSLCLCGEVVSIHRKKPRRAFSFRQRSLKTGFVRLRKNKEERGFRSPLSVDPRPLSLCGCLEAGAVKDALCALAEALLVPVVHGVPTAEAAGQPILSSLYPLVGHL